MYLSALIPLDPSLPEILKFSAAGFCVVLLVLSTLSLLTAFIGFFFRLADKIQSRPKQYPQAQQVKSAEKSDIPADHALVISAAVASMSDEISADSGKLIAVLSAAATVALGDEVRVVSFKPIDASYSRFGREQIFSSQNYTPIRNR